MSKDKTTETSRSLIGAPEPPTLDKIYRYDIYRDGSVVCQDSGKWVRQVDYLATKLVGEAMMANLREDKKKLVEALNHAYEALRAAKPVGHDGDEDGGGCDENCARCEVDAAMAHIEHVTKEW